MAEQIAEQEAVKVNFEDEQSVLKAKMTGKILKEVRARIAKLGNSEFAAVADQPMLRQMWEQIQDLRAEMNEAKKAAAAEAAKPYLETIEQVEKRYAMLLKLSSSN
jgi:hypothetical protein